MKYYLILLLIMQPIEEIHNCNHPNTLGTAPHMVCVWTDEDFIVQKDKTRILRPKRKKDNFIKAHYRKKYWKARKQSRKR